MRFLPHKSLRTAFSAVLGILPPDKYISRTLALALLAYLILIYCLLRRRIRIRRVFEIKCENFREEINLLSEKIGKLKIIQSSLWEKIAHYNKLRSVVDVMQGLSLPQICKHLTDCAYEMLSRNKGVCLLYLVDPEKQRLNLSWSRKEEEAPAVKQKNGDIFDRWVIKHASSLLVEDARVDFRFDLEKAIYKPQRPVLSLISAPFKVEQKFLGILRLDNCEPYFYTQDDLRMLDSICNIGVLGLENALLFKRTEELAIKDSLTSAYTKGYFLSRLEEEIKISLSLSQELCLMMVDIDNFKDYNDRFGHIGGDILLKRLGEIFTEHFSEVSGATVGRFGGEEFAIFLPNKTIAESENLAQLLRQKAQNETFVLRRKKTSITISIGLGRVIPNRVSSAKDLLFRADSALYKAKERGKNQVCIS